MIEKERRGNREDNTRSSLRGWHFIAERSCNFKSVGSAPLLRELISWRPVERVTALRVIDSDAPTFTLIWTEISWTWCVNSWTSPASSQRTTSASAPAWTRLVPPSWSQDGWVLQNILNEFVEINHQIMSSRKRVTQLNLLLCRFSVSAPCIWL